MTHSQNKTFFAKKKRIQDYKFKFNKNLDPKFLKFEKIKNEKPKIETLNNLFKFVKKINQFRNLRENIYSKDTYYYNEVSIIFKYRS